MPGLGAPGCGAVFVSFATAAAAASALEAMDGREFGEGSVVRAAFFPSHDFEAGALGPPLFGNAMALPALAPAPAPPTPPPPAAEAAPAPAVVVLAPPPADDLD